MSTRTTPILPDVAWLQVLSFSNPQRMALVSKRFQALSDSVTCQNFSDALEVSCIFRKYLTWDNWRGVFPKEVSKRAAKIRAFISSLYIDVPLPLDSPSTKQLAIRIKQLLPSASVQDFIAIWRPLQGAISLLKFPSHRFTIIPPLTTSAGANFSRVDTDPETEFRRTLVLSPDLALYRKIRALHLRGANHRVIPDLSFIFQGLKIVSLVGCYNLTHNPFLSGHFKNLEILSISGHIADRNTTEQTRHLDLHTHTLARPDSFEAIYKNLQFLRLLPKLHTLILNDNCLKRLPENLHLMVPSLKMLSVDNCFWLESLPTGMHKMRRLCRISMHNCYSLNTLPTTLRARIEAKRITLFSSYLIQEKPVLSVTLIDQIPEKPNQRTHIILRESTTPAIDSKSRVSYNDGTKGDIREVTPYNVTELIVATTQRVMKTLNFQ